jgi:hypothetical protein
MNPLKNKHWIGIRREPEGEEGCNKPGNGPFLRKKGNAAKHGVRLRRWWETQANGGDSQTPYVPNGKQG